MRVGILVESFPRISETWLVNQIIDLINRGIKVSIFSIYESKDSLIHQQVLNHNLLDRTQYFFNPKGSLIKKGWLIMKFFLNNFKNIKILRVLRAINSIRQKQIEPLFVFNCIFLNGFEELDILHAHFGEMGVIATKLKKVGLLKKSKIVVSFHGHDIFPFKREFYKKQYDIFHDFADVLLVNSIYSKELLNEIINFNNVKLIPVGLDTNYFFPQKDKKEKVVRILFVGRLIKLKGPDIAIELFRNLINKRKALELIIIGDGVLKKDLEKRIKKYGLKEYVKLLGALTQDEIIKYFNYSDIFLYPATYDLSIGAADTQGLVIQEAQAMGLPVVCSDVGGIKYGIINKKTAFLIKNGDFNDYLEKLQLLIDNTDLRETMGKNGREFVKTHFDSNIIGDQLISVYKEALLY